jgi:hypothetical protein
MTMNKKDFMKLMERVANSYNEKGNVELPTALTRAILHIVISDEVKETVENLNLDGCDYTEMKNKVSLALDRNDQQVGYYLRELHNNGVIDYTTASYTLSKPALTVLKALHKLGGAATLSEISKETGMVWSAIRSTLYGYRMSDYTWYKTDKNYDETGRRQTTVHLSNNGRKFCADFDI